MGFFSKLFSSIGATIRDNTPVKSNISNSFDANIPPLQGDYAKTIFLWAHEKPSAVGKDDEYVRYFLYECGIREPSAYHIELINAGYFEKAPIKMALDSLKIADLKQFLSSIGQTATGKKDALIERVVQFADDSAIKVLCPDELYVLSQMGKDFVEQHNDYVLVHKHKNWGIDWRELDLQRKQGYSFYDIVWNILNKQVLEDNQNFGRNAYFNMYQLLKEEDKHNKALEMLLRVLYIDISGACGIKYYKLYKSGDFTKNDILESFDAIIMIAPGIIKAILEYKDIYTDDIIDCIYEHKLPVQICDKSLFISIVHSVLDGSYSEECVTDQLKLSYSKFIKTL